MNHIRVWALQDMHLQGGLLRRGQSAVVFDTPFIRSSIAQGLLSDKNADLPAIRLTSKRAAPLPASPAVEPVVESVVDSIDTPKKRRRHRDGGALYDQPRAAEPAEVCEPGQDVPEGLPGAEPVS